MNFEYNLTVIIPIYNSSKTLDETLESVLNQKVSKNFNYEVLLIDDGSTDNSSEVCDKYVKKYSNIKYYFHENKGVSYTRNRGLDLAKGKYILFLDADDLLQENTFESVFKLFEKYYEHADILAYPLYNILDGEIIKHPRFDVYQKSGVFNATLNPYINQVTMNIVIKNLENKIYFDENLFQSEDAFFNSQMIFNKGNIIISSEGGYYYRIGNFSTVQKYKNPAIIGDKILELFEKYIECFEDENGLNPYIQSSILYEINWRFKSNSLYPFHLKGNEREEWDKRFNTVLSKISDEIILKQKFMDFYHKIYFLEKKYKNAIKVINDSETIYFSHHNGIFTKHSTFILVFNQVKFVNNSLKVHGYIKFPLLNYLKDLKLVIFRDGKIIKEITEFDISADSRYKSKQVTNIFYQFEDELNITNDTSYVFKVFYNGFYYDTATYMEDTCVFKKRYTKLTYVLYKNKHISYKDNPFTITVKSLGLNKIKYELINVKNSLENQYFKLYLFKKYNQLKKKENIWLYNDRINVFDNAYFQFKHDIKLKDGVKRYYITYKEENIDGKFTNEEKNFLVEYGSLKHKQLVCQATLILTSFQNIYEYNPFTNEEINLLSDLFTYKVIYLQHGVLHAHTPWIYSREKTNIDYFLTSSEYEKNMLITKYNYKEENIINLLMPRFTLTKEVKKSNKILFAPSWRISLTRGIKNLIWDLDEKALLQSTYYKETMNFLNSDELMNFLEENDLIMHFNLHPIFKGFKKYYQFKSNRIILIDNVDELGSYSLFITDFSSFVFDFVKNKIPVLFFISDYNEFLAGNHIYNKLELDLEKTFGKVAIYSNELIQNIKEIADNNFEILDRYKESYDNFFNHIEDSMGQLSKRLYDISLKQISNK